MRLRSGKSGLPGGNVVPRLRKCVYALAPKFGHGRKLLTKLAPAMHLLRVIYAAAKPR